MGKESKGTEERQRGRKDGRRRGRGEKGEHQLISPS